MITEWDLIRSLLDLQHSRRDLFSGTGDSPALSWLTMMRSKTRKGYSSETLQNPATAAPPTFHQSHQNRQTTVKAKLVRHLVV